MKISTLIREVEGTLLKAFFLAGLLVLAPLVPAAPAIAAFITDTGSPEGDQGLERYFAASQKSSADTRGVTMEVEMDAKVMPDREGKMFAMRTISRTGEVSYSGMSFEGSDWVKKEVIARYLQAEVEASKQTSLGISNDNYKFKYRGRYGSDNWQLLLYQVSPRRKAPGLFEGWLWVEATTGLPVQEIGRFVRNPSVVLKKVEFVRDYDIRSGVAKLAKVTSSIQARIIGLTQLTIQYRNYAKAPSNAGSSPLGRRGAVPAN
jgi:hypothetical protein